LRWAC